MAAKTTQTPQSTPAAPKIKGTPKTVVQRVTDQLKVAALRNKITADELDTIAALAGSLKTFLKA